MAVAKKKSKRKVLTSSQCKAIRNKGGRPSIYSEELAINICDQIANGSSLNKVCKAENMPSPASVFLWLGNNKWFSDKYAEAVEERAELMVEQMLEIADNEVSQPLVIDGIPVPDADGNPIMVKDSVAVAHAKLRVDTRKWIASKLKPKKYGEKTEVIGAGGAAHTVINQQFIINPVAADK